MQPDWSGPITTERVTIYTSRALCGSPTFRAHGEDCRFLVRDQDELVVDCAVIERDDLRTLIPATHPAAIDFRCAPDEVADLTALVAELRSRVGARLHVA